MKNREVLPMHHEEKQFYVTVDDAVYMDIVEGRRRIPEKAQLVKLPTAIFNRLVALDQAAVKEVSNDE